MTDDTSIQITVENDITVVTFGPALKHLDDTAVIECQDLLLATAQDASPPHVLFDLTNVHLFGSTFIEVIFRVWHRLNAEPDGRFGICGLSDYCLEVLKITHLDQLWKIYPSSSEAVAQLAEG
ncbi:MAG TPA: hypothetical protein DCE39_09220 [Planctomycetaceae bacterium]|jgi:anti-anti-sigma factor|nr:STAS domain-containing protein [Planctomycetales bacterium]HAA61101.1 hypothetical protein [Planctomycetaceae bacterium]|tara:strand:+ start:271 stop:639 length:369 start_codon:yes stop_codon:yes gene_type:complete